jgi:hypothetical protein
MVEKASHCSGHKNAGAEICDISASRLSHGDPWAFRPTLTNGLVLSHTTLIVCICADIIKKGVAIINMFFGWHEKLLLSLVSICIYFA